MTQEEETYLCQCGFKASDSDVFFGHLKDLEVPPAQDPLGRGFSATHFRIREEQYCSACGVFGHTSDGNIFWGGTKLCPTAKEKVS